MVLDFAQEAVFPSRVIPDIRQMSTWELVKGDLTWACNAVVDAINKFNQHPMRETLLKRLDQQVRLLSSIYVKAWYNSNNNIQSTYATLIRLVAAWTKKITTEDGPVLAVQFLVGTVAVSTPDKVRD